MKSFTLKFKAVLMAIALAGVAHPSIHAMDPMDIALTDSDYQNAFIEDMFIKIRDGVNATVDLVESFIDKTNPESFTNYLKRCEAQMAVIMNTIIKPLEAELAHAMATDPGSHYCKLLERTLKLAKEKAYKELEEFYKILKTHRNQTDPAKVKNASLLVKSLQPHLNKLLSTPTLDLLDNALADIQTHLPANVSDSITTEVENLTLMVKEIRTKAAAMQGKVSAELLPIIGARLKKL